MALLILSIVTALIAAVVYVALRRVKTSYPRPLLPLRDMPTFDRNLLAIMAEQRIGLSVMNPKAFVIGGIG